MPEDRLLPGTGTLSDFLNLFELRGQTWCFAEIGGSGGFSVPPNDDVMFYAVLRGSARIAGVGEGLVELAPGHVVFVLSGEPHALRTRTDSKAGPLDFLREERGVDVPPVISIGDEPVTTRILCARLKVDWPGGLRRMAMPPFVRLGEIGERSAAMRCETLQATAAGPGAASVLTRLASLMLASALREDPQCPLLFGRSSATDPIARALQLIGSDLAADWSVAKLARHVGMGRSNFAASFMAKVGRTPMNVLTERRMRFAIGLLRNGGLKIAEVSVQAGYRSEAAFSRRFTAFFGMAPGKMRRTGEHEFSGISMRPGWVEDRPEPTPPA